MNITEKQQPILEKLFAQRTEKLMPHLQNTLISMFQKDLPVYDMDYIESRIKEVIQNMQQDMDFSHEVIEAVRKNFLSELVKKIQANPPKPKTYRKKGDLTEQRNARCEALVHEILKALTDEKLLLTDEEYISEAIKDQNRILFDVIFTGYVDTFFSKMELILNQHLRDATKILWGGREKEEVTMKQVDQALKLGKKKDLTKQEK